MPVQRHCEPLVRRGKWFLGRHPTPVRPPSASSIRSPLLLSSFAFSIKDGPFAFAFLPFEDAIPSRCCCFFKSVSSRRARGLLPPIEVSVLPWNTWLVYPLPHFRPIYRKVFPEIDFEMFHFQKQGATGVALFSRYNISRSLTWVSAHDLGMKEWS